MLKLFSLITATVSAGCPKPTDIQSDQVKNNFEMSKFLGTYYEVAYHDYTQPIGVCGCQRSVKSLKYEHIYDDFTLNCGSKTNNSLSHTYHNNLTFSTTDTPGYFVGKWPIVSAVAFPDTLVDFGAVNSDGQYSWVLEFQCVETLGHIDFIGVNFYSSVKTPDFLEEMKASATAYGIDEYIYAGNQLTLVDQTGCQYNNTNILPGDEAKEFSHFMEGIEDMLPKLEFLQ